MTAAQAQLDLGVTDEDDPAATIDLTDGLVALGEPKGVVYTKPWVVDLILDLAGYRTERDLAARYVVEPSAGEGAFLGPMVRRLLESIRQHGRSLSDARSALHAYELDEGSAAQAITLATKELEEWGASSAEAVAIARSWVTVGDYLLESRRGHLDGLPGGPVWQAPGSGTNSCVGVLSQFVTV
jgi:hypothetical protein